MIKKINTEIEKQDLSLNQIYDNMNKDNDKGLSYQEFSTFLIEIDD